MELVTKKSIPVANWRPKNGPGDQKKFSSSQLANENISQRRALSRCLSAHLKQLIRQKKRKTGREHWGIPLTAQGMLGAEYDDVTGDFGSPA